MPLLSDIQKQNFLFKNPKTQDYVKRAKKNVSLLNNVFKKMSKQESNEDFRIAESVFSLDKDGVLLLGTYYIGNWNKTILRVDINANYRKSVVKITFSPYVIIDNKQQYISELLDDVVKFDMQPEKNEPCLFIYQNDKSDIEYKDYLEKEFAAFYRKVTSIVKEKYLLLIEYSEKIEDVKTEAKRVNIMRKLKRVNEAKHTEFLRSFVSVWNKKKSPKLEIMSEDTAVGRGDDEMFVVELYEDEECVKVSRYDLSSEDDYFAEDLDYL